MSEDCACLVVECAVAILTQIPLVLSIAAVSDRAVRTAARTGYTITPANLLQQIRCDRFRSKHVERNHSYQAPLRGALVLFDSTATAQQYQQSPTGERLEFVEREVTPEFLMKLSIQLHLVGLSLLNTVRILKVFGV